MLITVECPHCQSRYNIQPSLCGQALRCNACRRVYIAGQSEAQQPGKSATRDAPATPKGGGQSGNVSDLLPVLSAEVDGTPTLEPIERAPMPEPIDDNGPAQFESWQDAPPPVRSRDSQPAEKAAPTPTKPATKTLTRRDPDTRIKAPTPKPTNLPPADAFEPPPVRRGGPSDNASTLATRPNPIREPINSAKPENDHVPSTPVEPAVESSHEIGDEPPRRRRSVVALASMIAALLGIGVGVPVWYFGFELPAQERRLYDGGLAKLAEGNFPLAQADFEALVRKFPDSENVDEYRTLQHLTEHRIKLAELDTVAAIEPLNNVDRFLQEEIAPRQHEALLQQHSAVLKDGVVRYVKLLADSFQNPTDDRPAAMLERIDEVVAALDRTLGPEHGFRQAERESLKASQATIRNGLDALAQRRKAVDEIDELVRHSPNGDGVRAAQAMLDRLSQSHPGIRDAANVRAKLEELYAAHREHVKWIEGGEATARPPAEEAFPSLIIDPLIQGPPGRGRGGEIVLALVRGVLYALDRVNGQVQWASRVGIDTTNLPLRVPATESSPERILVVATDTRSVSALDAEGHVLWKHRLDSQALGRPAVVGRRVYLTTFDGHVHVLELVEGQLLGRFQIGQPLSLGPTYDPSTGRLYVAADNSCVYVLDPESRQCEAILYTDHASGSLRSEPMVVPAQSAGEIPGFLVLNRSKGGENALTVYELPIRERRQAPAELRPEPRIPGWSWFRPHQDSEKIVVLSDAGVLGAFGIKQPHNNLDGLLFPFLSSPSTVAGETNVGLPLDRLLQADASVRSRAEVVHGQSTDLWVMAHGKLQRLRVGWYGPTGPRLMPGWPKALELGSPQHASQVAEDRQGRATLFVVTQSLNRPVHLASAVEDETGKLLWQRQLGMTCLGEPLVLDLGEGRSLVLAMDEGGSLFTFDPSLAARADRKGSWQSQGKLLARGVDESSVLPPILLPGAAKGTALQVAALGDSTTMVVRQITPSGEGVGLQVREQRVSLPAPLAGAPARIEDRLIVPLTNGALAWVALGKENAPFEGPNWRRGVVGDEARGYVAALDGSRLLATDGARGLTVWDWPQPASFLPLPAGREPPTIELPDRIIGTPFALPDSAPKGPRQVIVPTADNALTLLTIQPNGATRIDRTWKLTGPISMDLFSLADSGRLRVGCVVGGTQLLALDPAKDDPAWEYRTTGKAIVGIPQRAENWLLVADHSGRYVALDPATGKPLGPGHQLAGTLGPAATPVAFGSNRLFAPLTDGTVLLLPLNALKISDDANSR